MGQWMTCKSRESAHRLQAAPSVLVHKQMLYALILPWDSLAYMARADRDTGCIFNHAALTHHVNSVLYTAPYVSN